MDMEHSYNIVKAEYLRSIYSIKELPTDAVSEVSFVGRSNVGKSSLINALCQKSGLAKTSKTPGRTQAFNYFDIEFYEKAVAAQVQKLGEKAPRMQGRIVDLPGYGYAEAPKALRKKWPEQIEQYLMGREQLKGLFLLMDCRREPGDEEKWLCEYGRDGSFVLVLTKADKLSRNEFEKHRRDISNQLKLPLTKVLGISVEGKQKRGIEELRTVLCDWLVL